MTSFFIVREWDIQKANAAFICFFELVIRNLTNFSVKAIVKFFVIWNMRTGFPAR
jgi:hypothetical protein